MLSDEYTQFGLKKKGGEMLKIQQTHKHYTQAKCFSNVNGD